LAIIRERDIRIVELEGRDDATSVRIELSKIIQRLTDEIDELKNVTLKKKHEDLVAKEIEI
jgi:hypothetical protein